MLGLLPAKRDPPCLPPKTLRYCIRSFRALHLALLLPWGSARQVTEQSSARRHGPHRSTPPGRRSRQRGRRSRITDSSSGKQILSDFLVNMQRKQSLHVGSSPFGSTRSHKAIDSRSAQRDCQRCKTQVRTGRLEKVCSWFMGQKVVR